MKRNLLTFFFCLAFLGASAASQAESSAPESGIQGTVPAVSVQEASSYVKESSEAGLPPALPAEPRTASFNMCSKGEPEGGYYLYSDSQTEFNAACTPTAEYKLTGDGLFALNEDEFPPLEASSDDEAQAPDVPIVVNKSVKSFITYFQTRGRKYFERWLGRSQNYMSMLRGILRENGLPEDLSYIAFIESGLNPTAKSRANAVGMWQFIKGTALKYGLRVDWWIDERMDPEKATYAAARYFKNLYDQFGSWYLAAAGYNAGEGKVLRAVKKHGSDDFWVLASYRRPFKRETKEYVPKYLAAIMIAKDPKNYGFDEQAYIDGLPYDKVKIPQATDLRVIAEAAGTTVEEIKRLNPELLRWFTPPNYPDYEVKIPAGTKGQFEENMSKIPAPERIAFLQHKVRRGETIAKIAKLYGTNIKPILYLNNLKSAKHVKPGTVIAVPVRPDHRKGKEVAEVLTYPGLMS